MLFLSVWAAACGNGGGTEARDATPPATDASTHASAGAGASPASDLPAQSMRTVVFLGTSLTAGLGVEPEAAYPALIQARIEADGLPYRVINAGVSGETSAGALRRLDWVLRQPVDVLVVETGANDGLRGQDPDATRFNVDAILTRARARRPAPRLVLVAMEAPPNYGAEYARRFRALYPELAQKHEAGLVPFLLRGVAGVPALNQPDGVHPTPEGHRKIAENIWPALRAVLAAD